MKLSTRGGGLFVLSLVIATLINVNFSILRSAKQTLVITAQKGGAEVVPHLHLWAVLPASIGVTWTLSHLLSRYRAAIVFPLTTSAFLLFFLSFGFILFPQREAIHDFLGVAAVAARLSRWGALGLGFLVEEWSYTLFYVAAELWKVALLTVLFFGYLNTLYALASAKRAYGPLMLGGSLGGLIAGPLIGLCCPPSATWEQALQKQMGVVALLGLFIVLAFNELSRRYGGGQLVPERPRVSLLCSLQTVLRSRYLIGIGLVVLCDYVVYSLGELVFLDLLRVAYPDPVSNCALFGRLAFWSGLLTGVGALVVTPLLLSRFRWVVTALVTPVVLLVTVGSFFTLVWIDSRSVHLALLPLTVVCGSVQFCCCRAAKYTLFDASKELAFVALLPEEQLQGKLVIDGVTARFGRAAAAVMSMGLVSAFGDIRSAAPTAACIAFGALIVWISAVCLLGRRFDLISGIKSVISVS